MLKRLGLLSRWQLHGRQFSFARRRRDHLRRFDRQARRVADGWGAIVLSASPRYRGRDRRMYVTRCRDLRLKRHIAFIQGGLPMRLSSAIRAALIALTVTGAGLATAAYADSGAIRFNVIKAGFVVGGSAGSGTLAFHGRRYRLAIGGVSYGFTLGASAIDFIGIVSNIRRASDVNGVYAAAGAGAAVGAGAGAIVLTNQNGAVLTLSGRQAGLIVAADLNGLAIS